MATPLVSSPVAKVGISLLPILCGVVIRLLDRAIGSDPGASLQAIDARFWNLSFDMLFTAIGVFFGAALFTASERVGGGTAVVGVILIVGVFGLIFLNMIYPHIGWLGGSDPAVVTVASNLVGLLVLGLCVHAT